MLVAESSAQATETRAEDWLRGGFYFIFERGQKLFLAHSLRRGLKFVTRLSMA
jgi:hypothetical protein